MGCILRRRAGCIYYLTGDTDYISGGKKEAYRQVDILNRNGFRAYALHSKKGFRYSWFENKTPVKIIREVRPGVSDYLVLPEVYDVRVEAFGRGIKKVILNQNAHYTFRHDAFSRRGLKIPYLDEDVVGTMVVSDHNYRYLRHAFPGHPFTRIHYGIDQDLFSYSSRKKKQIALTFRKIPDEVVQLLNILKLRGVLKEFGLARIDNVPEGEVARILKESLIFLSFAHQEGFSLLSTEAMACGCVVIGYHAYGGREFLQKRFSYPVAEGDILGFAKTVEDVVRRYRTDKAGLKRMGREASDFVSREYSLAREEKDVVSFWEGVLSRA